MDDVISGILRSLKEKDWHTYAHSVRVGKMAGVMAKKLLLDREQAHVLAAGCLLHDIGKLHVPSEILKKEEALTEAEWVKVKEHPAAGAALAGVYGIDHPDVLGAIRHHHERWDGAGYPCGLSGEQIPLNARICSIIDAFDSMINDRPYRKGMPAEAARSKLWSQCQAQFDRKLLRLFLDIQWEGANLG